MESADILEIIAKALDKVSKLCSPEDLAKIKEVLLQLFQEGKPPLKTLKTPEEDTELIYSFAASLYEGGKYKEAMPGFWRLFMLNPSDPRYIYGFAACLHKLKRYQEAIENYFVAARIDPGNPVYWGHAADCYIQLGSKDLACVMLTKAIEAAGDNPQYAELKKQASLMHQQLKSQSGGINIKEDKAESPISSEVKTI